MLIQYLFDYYPDYESGIDIGSLQELYVASKKKFDTDDIFQTNARKRVIELQSGNLHVIKRMEIY